MRYCKVIKYILPVFILAVTLQGCDCIRGQLGMPTSGEIARMKEEMRIKEEQQKAQMERERFVQDSLAKAELAAKRVIEGYHVIVGCFKDWSNAERMETSLKAKGYPDAVRIQLKNGYMMVSLGSMEKLRDAVRLMEKASEDPHIQYFDDIWVYGATQGLHKED